MNEFEFIQSERASRDTLDVKRIYIDMADDLVAGVLLSQIIYWHLPDQHGKSKLRVKHEGHYWIAKQRAEWWDECRITEKQYDRAAGILEDKGIIITDTTLFAGKPSKVVRLNFDAFLPMYTEFLADPNRGEKRSSPKGNNELAQRESTITETTTENKQQPLSEKWTAELQNAVIGIDGQTFKDITEEWQKRPDPRRHTEAMRQTLAAHQRSARVYYRAYCNFNPDWTPQPRGQPRPPAPYRSNSALRTRTD